MATKTAYIRARTEPKLKYEAESVMRKLGVSPSNAINMFYRQVALKRALPFDVALPSATTLSAMEDAERGRDLIEADSAEELIAKLGN